MYELIPIVAGVGIALVVRYATGARFRIAMQVVLSITFGTVASIVSGELFTNWVFVLVDASLTLLSVVATNVLIWAWTDRRALQHQR